MILLIIFFSAAAWLCVLYAFEAGYKTLKPDYHGSLQKHQWCWLFWSALGIFSCVSTGAAGLIQLGLIFIIASGHISCCCAKEDFISPREVILRIPQALKEVYERIRKI